MTGNINYLPNLVSVTLKNCNKCEYLPTLGQLSFLKFLFIGRMNAVKTIGSEFYCSNEEAPNISFRSLEKLTIAKMDNLKEWSENLSCSPSFPCLKTLEIHMCFKLTSTPTLFPSLQNLFYSSSNIPLSSMLTTNLASLTSIDISYCSELMFLPLSSMLQGNVLRRLIVSCCDKLEGFFSNQEEKELSNSSLVSLDIHFCPALKYVPNLRGLNSLRDIDIIFCKSLKSLPDGIQYLTGLEHLSIGPFSEELEYFPFPSISRISEEGTIHQGFVSLRALSIWGWSGLKSLPDQLQYLTSLQTLSVNEFPSLVALPDWLGNLASLQSLLICWCQNIKYLPSQEHMLCLTSLRELILRDCPLLEERCHSDDESHKIAHIPNFRILPS